MVDYPETVIYTKKDRVWCMGEDLDHPKYITVCLRKALQGVIIVI